MGVITVIGTILKGAELTEKIRNVIREENPAPPRDLTEKSRWYQCTIQNCTQFPLLYQETYFDEGRWLTAPGDVQRFERMVFSACNKDGRPGGASGGIALRLKLDEEQFFDIATGLSSPMMGPHKAGVVESSRARDGYDIASKHGNAIVSRNQYRAKDGDDPDREVDIQFQVSAQPGPGMLIIITEVRL